MERRVASSGLLQVNAVHQALQARDSSTQRRLREQRRHLFDALQQQIQLPLRIRGVLRRPARRRALRGSICRRRGRRGAALHHVLAAGGRSGRRRRAGAARLALHGAARLAGPGPMAWAKGPFSGSFAGAPRRPLREPCDPTEGAPGDRQRRFPFSFGSEPQSSRRRTLHVSSFREDGVGTRASPPRPPPWRALGPS